MPSVIFTTEEIFDNILFGSDGLIGVTSVAVISANDVLDAIGDVALATAIAAITASELTLFVAENATVTATAAVSADAGGQGYIEEAVVTSIAAVTSTELAAYIDAAPVSASAVTLSFNIVGGVDGSSVSSIAAQVALDRSAFADSATLAVTTQPAAAEGIVFTQVDLTVSTAILSALNRAGFVDAVTTPSNTLIVAQEVYTSSGNTFNTYTDADTSVSHTVLTALDGKVWADTATVPAVAVPSASLDIQGVSDASTVTVFQAISAIDIHLYVSEAATVTSQFAESEFSGQDTFTRTIADTATGTWGTSDGGYTWAIDSGNTADPIGVNGTHGHAQMSGSKHVINQILQVPPDSDWDMTIQAQWDAPAIGAPHAVFLSARYQASSRDWYLLRLRMNTDGSIDTANETNLAGATTFISSNTVVQAAGGWTTGQVWNLRLQLIGTQLNTKVWPASVSEPGSWTTSTTSSSVTGSGTIGAGFTTAFGYSGTANFLVDNLTFTNLGVASLDTLAAVDSGTMRASASPSAVEVRATPYVDAATAAADAVPSSIDTYVSSYAFFDSFIRSPVSGGWGTPSNGGNPWVVINGQDPDFSTTGTLGRIVVANTSGHEIAVAVTGTGTSKYNIGQFTQWQWNTTNNGTLPVQIGAHLYWVDEINRYYYRLVVGQKPSTGSLQLSLDKVIASGTTTGLGGYNIITSSSSVNTYYNLRTEASGLNTSNPTLKARLWLASASEPNTWGFTYTDTSGSYPALNANYGFRTNIFAGDTNNPTLKFSQYYGYYL